MKSNHFLLFCLLCQIFKLQYFQAITSLDEKLQSLVIFVGSTCEESEMEYCGKQKRYKRAHKKLNKTTSFVEQLVFSQLQHQFSASDQACCSKIRVLSPLVCFKIIVTLAFGTEIQEENEVKDWRSFEGQFREIHIGTFPRALSL